MVEARSPAASYVCQRARVPLVIDGDLDKEAWQSTPRTQRFPQAGSGAATLFNTQAAMLWDDANLFVAFWIEEPDVWCTEEIRNGITWLENTVEVSIAGSGAYYNLSVAAMERTSELFFIWKDSYQPGGRYDVPECDLAVQRPMVFGTDEVARRGPGLAQPAPAWDTSRFLQWRNQAGSVRCTSCGNGRLSLDTPTLSPVHAPPGSLGHPTGAGLAGAVWAVAAAASP